MNLYQGYYSYDSPDNVQVAEVSLKNDKIEIHLRDAHGNPRVVHWYWYNVMEGKHTAAGMELHHIGLPQQTLRVSSGEFAALAEKKLRKKKRAFPTAAAVFLTAGAVVTGLLALVYFWLVPFLAGRLANTMPVEYEVKMGNEAYGQLIKEYKILPEKTELVNTFFKQLDIQTKYPVQITVVEEKQVNAFAVPGGHIVVFSGLLDKMRRPEELAALLAHEYSHVELRHTTRSLMQSLGTYMAVSLIFGDLTGVSAVLVENASSLKNLEYSRSLEKEADLNGLRLLEARHINPEGYIWLFGTLKTEGGGAPSEWLSSHPDMDNRIGYVKKEMKPARGETMPAAMQATWKQIRAEY
ncbi:M48 family metallopeptidase [Chitinophaga sp. GCM10012297]|uniref:M48 family metallopeptidase n=1 Tax=Chitinophaga chungangae TaxID=2821488 RepID=A0ABS3YCT8_9BACT|nr:M48 family metallopeptidase [Chitinophaga chungangae]MBO9152497.1 M48 family metallopeptidase [Chitinophaga chungangae]